MPFVSIQGAGAAGVNKDLSAADMPNNTWTDAKNIRFLDGMAQQFFGQGEVYNSPSVVPQHVLPCTGEGVRYWVYASAAKVFCVTLVNGAAVHTDITPALPRTGVPNQWTSTLLSGIPLLNSGDTLNIPMYWGLDPAATFQELPAWPAQMYCKSLRSYKNYLVALNVTKSGVNLPYMVKWSSAADPGSLPATWDETDPTQDAGEVDLAEGYDQIIDGLQLRDYFIIYKESSIWAMSLSGNEFIFNFAKVLGTSGALNGNCIVEVDGWHLVLTGSDVIYHDGQSATSVLDKQTRRYLFQNIDTANNDKCFVFKNPFFNEVFICYPGLGSASCDQAMVWNYVDKTVSFRDMPNMNHAAFGPVDNSLAGSWDSDPAPWESDLTLWNGPDFVPATARVLMASNDQKLYMLDASASFNGVLPDAYMERRGLSFGQPDRLKLVRAVRPRITGNVGLQVAIQIGYSNDPYIDPTYGPVMMHTIGTTVHNDCFVTGRYIAVRFATGDAYQFRLDSYDLDIVDAGGY